MKKGVLYSARECVAHNPNRSPDPPHKAQWRIRVALALFKRCFEVRIRSVAPSCQSEAYLVGWDWASEDGIASVRY